MTDVGLAVEVWGATEDGTEEAREDTEDQTKNTVAAENRAGQVAELNTKVPNGRRNNLSAQECEIAVSGSSNITDQRPDTSLLAGSSKVGTREGSGGGTSTLSSEEEGGQPMSCDGTASSLQDVERFDGNQCGSDRIWLSILNDLSSSSRECSADSSPVQVTFIYCPVLVSFAYMSRTHIVYSK